MCNSENRIYLLLEAMLYFKQTKYSITNCLAHISKFCVVFSNFGDIVLKKVLVILRNVGDAVSISVVVMEYPVLVVIEYSFLVVTEY